MTVSLIQANIFHTSRFLSQTGFQIITRGNKVSTTANGFPALLSLPGLSAASQACPLLTYSPYARVLPQE